MNCLAFDFGGTFVKGAVVDTEGNIKEKWKDKAPLESKEAFADYIRTKYTEYQDQTGGIVISMPGIIDSHSGYAYRAGSYKKVAETNIYELLKDIPVPKAVENDGKAATLAEMWKGGLKGVSTGAVVVIGTGLGGGIVVNGQLHKGSHFAAGEITGVLLRSGDYSMNGCAALNCGMTAFLMKVANAKGMDPSEFEISANFLGGRERKEKRIGGREVLEWVRQKDKETCRVYHEWISDLMEVILNLQIILDTETVLIGGGVSQNEMFIEDLKEEYRKAGEKLSIYRRFNTRIDVCTFKEDANLVGALYNWKILNEKHPE